MKMKETRRRQGRTKEKRGSEWGQRAMRKQL